MTRAKGRGLWPPFCAVLGAGVVGSLGPSNHILQSPLSPAISRRWRKRGGQIPAVLLSISGKSLLQQEDVPCTSLLLRAPLSLCQLRPPNMMGSGFGNQKPRSFRLVAFCLACSSPEAMKHRICFNGGKATNGEKNRNHLKVSQSA